MGWTFYNSSGQQMRATADKAATQAEMEAGSSTTAFVTPGRTQHHPGVAKAWIRWEASGAHSILGSYNITSVTDGGQAGDTDGVIATDFSSINEQAFTAATDDSKYLSIGTSAAGTWTSRVYDFDGTLNDNARNMMAIFGDQA